MYVDRVKLCAALTKVDWNMTELSQKSGISRQTLSAVRHGKRCRTQTAEKIALALGVNIRDIVEGRQNEEA